MVMQYTNQAQLKALTLFSDLPVSSPVTTFLKCVRETVKCGRLYNSFLRWFSEKRKKGIQFSYRFTGLESKKFSWNFASLIQEVLKIGNLSQGSVTQLHTLTFAGLKLRDTAAIYSRVDINSQQVEDLKTMCHDYFTAHRLLLNGVNPTVWTLGYAIPYHTKQMVEKEKKNACDSYIPKRVRDGDNRFCLCGLSKPSTDDSGCTICTSSVMNMVKQSVATGKVTPELKQFLS